MLIAFDEEIGREIALKELIPPVEERAGVIEPEGDIRQLRFLREAQVTGQLEHPSIVPVYEIGKKPDGRPYYTMRLVRGETLSGAIRAAKTLRERLLLLPHFRDLCNAVAYAHSRGVIHRDIKPDNIMIGQFGETVLLDWGLAKVRGQSDERAGDMEQELSALRGSPVPQTLTGKAFGTPAYMAPEQARGLIEEIDERSDIYALGAVLYEILTGDPPFDGRAAADILAKVVTDEPIPIAQLVPEAPPDLCALAEKMLAKRKEARYGAALEVAREVENYMAGGRIGAYDYSSWELFKRFVRKNRALSLLIGVTALLVIIGSAVVFLAWRNAIESERMAHLNLALGYQENAERMIRERRYDKAEIFAAAALWHNPWNERSPYRFPDLDRRPKAERSARTLSARSSLYLARMNQNDALLAAVYREGAEVRDVAVSPDGTVAALAARDGSVVLWDLDRQVDIDRLSGHRDEVTAVAFSPDGSLLASASWDRTVRIWDVATRTELATENDHVEEVYAVAWMPDGRRVVSGGNDGLVRIWDVVAQREAGMVPLRDTRIRSVAVAPDAATIAVGSTTGELFLIRGATVTRHRPHTETLFALRYGADGTRLYSAGYDKRALVLDARDGAIRKTFVYWDAFFAMDLDRRHDRVVLASRDTTLLLWDTRTGKAEPLRGHDGAVQSAAFTADGARIVSTGAEGTIRLWKTDIQRPVRIFSGHRTYIPALAISPDGKVLASSSWDHTVKIWDNVNEEERYSFNCPEVCQTLAFQPNGPLLAIAGQDRRITLFDTRKREAVAFMEGHEETISSLAFSPDGRLLVSGSWDRTVRIWDVAERRMQKLLSDHTSPVHAVAFSPDGTRIASAGRDKIIVLREVNGPAPVATFAGHTANILSLAFSPDGTLLASAAEDETVIIHRLADGVRVKIFQTQGAAVNAIAFSPDGRYLLAVGKQALVWETGSGEDVVRLPLMHAGYAVAFSPDGTRFALGEGAAIYLYPTRFDVWNDDPMKLLRDAEERARYRLEGFRIFVKGTVEQ